MDMAVVKVWGVVVGMFQEIMAVNMAMRPSAVLGFMFVFVMSIGMCVPVFVGDLFVNVGMVVVFFYKDVCSGGHDGQGQEEHPAGEFLKD